MFRIRRIYDANNPGNEAIVAQAQQILRDQFSLIHVSDVEKLPDMLRNPLKYRFRAILFAADDIRGHLSGFALLLHAPDLDFCYLDYISTAKHLSGQGVGGALYERIRAEATLLRARGLFFECLPDDPALCLDPAMLKQNRSRLRFYEKYGARPMIRTRYETPVTEGDDNPPCLVIDTLNREKPLKRRDVRRIVKAILERKYPDVCNRQYVRMVVNSIVDDPVQLRPFKYVTAPQPGTISLSPPPDRLITLVYNDQHIIHHVHERGYVESPVRVKTILSALDKTGLFHSIPFRHFGDGHITAVHDKDFFAYLQKVCANLGEKESVYPYVFPIRNNTRPPKELPMRAGYYCIDTFTPLNRNAYLAARNAVNCALTAAQAIIDGGYLAYALVRPPGHHAERNVFGGFCYFNSTAIAANYMSKFGRVAILDLDYHHGNGQQSIFYERDDVLTISIHGHPKFAYPFFSGFSEETGAGKGLGYSMNFPLPETIEIDRYIKTVEKAIYHVRKFDPRFLVVALGLDTARGDPTGTWGLGADDFMAVGRLVGELPYSTLFVQEGGYRTKTIGRNAQSFFRGVWGGSFG